MRCALLLLAALLPFAAVDDEPEMPPDEVELANGRTVEGELLRQDQHGVWIAQKSRIRHYEPVDVVKVTGPRALYPEYAAKMREEFAQDPDDERCVAFAQWCEENGLVRDAELYYWRALLDNPLNEAANEALEHREYRGRYRIPVKGEGRLSLQELRELRRADFDEAWQLTTMHFEVEAAGDLPDVLRACADLESVYFAFYQRFQDVVGFWYTREPIKVKIYPSFEDMPPVSGNTRAYFHDSTRTVYTYLRDGVAQEIPHEGFHAILYYAIREFARNDPATPGWLNEGLAEYMEHHLIGNPGARDLVPEPPHYPSFATHIRHERPDSIQRVLNYQQGDYYASTDQALKYAQSYTLFYYLMHGGEPQQRDNLNRFLASIFERKGSSTHFKELMMIDDWDDFEERWTTYVRETLEEAGDAYSDVADD